MRIARFDEGRVGLVVGEELVDVTDVLGIDPAEWPPVGPNRLIRDFDSLRPRLEEAAASAPRRPLASVRLRTPVPAAT